MQRLLKKIIPPFAISWYHFGLALLGALLYRFPSRGMVVIGVTGTNGKSTVVDMISRVLSEAGFKTASFSTIRFQIKEKEWRNTLKMTMPGRFLVQKFLRQAKDAGCTHVVVEVTSEGILQHRHRFISFHTAVLTNLSPEHIERHGSFENYRQAKGQLFAKKKKVHILNGEDKNVDFFLKFQAEQKYLYGRTIQNSSGKKIQAENIQATSSGLQFSVEGIPFQLRLKGEFNVQNALAAVCVGLSQGASLPVIAKALSKIEKVPGRMEEIISSPFHIFVDYAFTPAALEKVYATLLKDYQLKEKNKKLICILGAAGGGRDKWKRPVLGGIAEKYCNEVIVTNEDPYEEDPMRIISQVAQGKAQKILDRREAIARALSFAQPDDVVIITGKGSEDSMAIAGGKKIPWDDREVVREEFGRIKKEGRS